MSDTYDPNVSMSDEALAMEDAKETFHNYSENDYPESSTLDIAGQDAYEVHQNHVERHGR
jgi:hypothetical protein